jgi:hypothetical protein
VVITRLPGMPIHYLVLLAASDRTQLPGTSKSSHFTKYAAGLTVAPSPSNPTKTGVRRPERELCSLCFRIRTPIDLRESPGDRLERGSALDGMVVQRLGELAERVLLMAVKRSIV